MSLTLVKPFTPKPPSNTVSITPTTSSNNVALSLQAVLSVAPNGSLRIVNNSGGLAYIKQGADNTVVAAATDIPILSGEIEVIGLRPETTYIAAVLATGTATGAIYFSTGEGI